jgi:hypothetical protein
MVLKYRDVIRMTLFGRHDKNINDTSSIYQGYDRYATTTTGGGVNSITVLNNGTVGLPMMSTLEPSSTAKKSGFAVSRPTQVS